LKEKSKHALIKMFLSTLDKTRFSENLV